jgi:hypothetical protein
VRYGGHCTSSQRSNPKIILATILRPQKTDHDTQKAGVTETNPGGDEESRLRYDRLNPVASHTSAVRATAPATEQRGGSNFHDGAYQSGLGLPVEADGLHAPWVMHLAF